MRAAKTLELRVCVEVGTSTGDKTRCYLSPSWDLRNQLKLRTRFHSTPSRQQSVRRLAVKPISFSPQSSEPTVKGPSVMLPARRNKVDLSVRTFLISNRTSHHQSHVRPRLRTIQREPTDAGDVADADQCILVLDFLVYDRGGAEALSSVRQTPYPQECVEQDAEGPSPIHPGSFVHLTSYRV